MTDKEKKLQSVARPVFDGKIMSREEHERLEAKKVVDSMFTYHAPTEDDKEKYRAINTAAKSLCDTIIDKAPTTELRNQAIMAVFKARMLANAAIAVEGKGEVNDWCKS